MNKFIYGVVLLAGAALIALLLYIAGSRNDEYRRGGVTHVLFLGSWSDPSFEDLQVGSIYGGSDSVGVFHEGSFGEIASYYDGVRTGTFNRGSVFINLSAGKIDLRGGLEVNMLVLVFELVGGGNRYRLVHKERFEKSESFTWSYRIE